METLKINIYVHTPVTEYSIGGGYYTSYAIYLVSNNPCFSSSHSHVRRRYSDFVRLRDLLISHHPTISPPPLPPKSYFNRFEVEFIEKRMKGLQKFLKEVLSIPVYLSDKSLHLFLQSNSSMLDINKECLGDIPAPPLIDQEEMASKSQTSTIKSVSDPEAQCLFKTLQKLTTNNCKIGVNSEDTGIHASYDIQPSITPILNRNQNKPILITKRNSSLNSSTASSPSSSPSETSCSSCSEHSKERHVSFNERVKIAVVTHCGISVLRS